MTPYHVELKPSVEKDLRALPKSVCTRVWRQIERLPMAPLSLQAVKRSGTDRLYRVRVGDYRTSMTRTVEPSL